MAVFRVERNKELTLSGFLATDKKSYCMAASPQNQAFSGKAEK